MRMENIYLTRNVKENLDLRILAKIIEILREKIRINKNMDYFQIFEMSEDTLINKQEIPEEKKEYKLNFKVQNKEKIWAVQGIDETVGEYWTIMYPEEYQEGEFMEIKEIMKKLQEPFEDSEIEFRVGATNSDKTKGMALAYVQARAIQNRLDSLFGVDGWSVSYKEITAGFICSLSVKINDKWITKEDGAPTTEFESVKGGISSAFKRVASSGFGIGRYLYNAKNMWFPIKQQGRGYIFITEPKLELNDKIISKDDKENKRNGIIIDFGKYKGMTLEEIYEKDHNYIKYLKDKAKDAEIIKACTKLIA